jgi:hypothetical protein
MLFNSVYQAQMHSYFEIGLGMNLCFVFDENEHLIDFIWKIKSL